MAIERAIHTSLKQGIESSSSGYHFYSYTPGIPDIKSQCGNISTILTSSYNAPDNQDWMKDQSTGEILDFSEYKNINIASDLAGQINPRSFLFSIVDCSGTPKAVFSYSKDMGFEFSGSRPGNVYIYSCICDLSDIKNYPVMYSFSPAVCCDILRSEFYPTKDGLPAASPLGYISSLSSNTGIVDLKFCAGFEEITENNIIEFLLEEDRISVFRQMASLLFEIKSGSVPKKLVIADSQRNTMLWIAALTYIFPIKNSLNISFKSYEFSLENYDINGVFIPSLNNIDKSDNITQCRLDENINKYFIFDFSKGNFSEEAFEEKYTKFFDIFENMLNMGNMNVLSKYKNFVESSTTFSAADGSYIDGFYLYAFQNMNFVELDNEEVRKGIEFCKKYCSNAYQKILFDRIYDYYLAQPSDKGRVSIVAEFLSYAIEKGILPASKRSELVKNVTDAFVDSGCDFHKFNSLCQNTMELCNMSSCDIDIEIVKVIKMEKMTALLKGYSKQENWRAIQIISCITSCIKNHYPGYSQMKPDSAERAAFCACLELLVESDSVQEEEMIVKIVNKVMASTSDYVIKFMIADAAVKTLHRKGLKNLTNAVLDVLAECVSSAGEANKKMAFKVFESDEWYSYYAIAVIRAEIERAANMNVAFENVVDTVRCMSSNFRDCQNDIFNIVNAYLKKIGADSSDVYYNFFILYNTCVDVFKNPFNIEVARDIVKVYFARVKTETIEYRIAPEKYASFKMMCNNYKKLRLGDIPSDILIIDAVYCMYISMQRSGNRNPVGLFAEQKTTDPLEYSLLSEEQRRIILHSVVAYGYEFWIKSDCFPQISTLFHFSSSEDGASVYEIYLRLMLEKVVQNIEDKKRASRIQAISVLAIKNKFAKLCESIPQISHGAGIKKNELIKAFETYLKNVDDSGMVAGVNKMLSSIENYYTEQAGDSTITKFIKMFKK